jgi:hypothetical protein
MVPRYQARRTRTHGHRNIAPGRTLGTPLAVRMHSLAVVLSFVACCALVTQLFKRCARSQRAAFLDAPQARRVAYQALPTTIV